MLIKGSKILGMVLLRFSKIPVHVTIARGSFFVPEEPSTDTGLGKRGEGDNNEGEAGGREEGMSEMPWPKRNRTAEPLIGNPGTAGGQIGLTLIKEQRSSDLPHLRSGDLSVKGAPGRPDRPDRLESPSHVPRGATQVIELTYSSGN